MRRASRKSSPVARPARGDNRFVFLTSMLAASAALGVAMFMGCGSDAEGDGGAASTTGNFSTGTLDPAVCRDGFPNGVCENFASPAETCECEDCAALAACHDLCADDGQCNFAPGTGEDCTCADCHTGNQQCVGIGNVYCSDPNPDTEENDDYNPECTADESCVCADCADNPACGCDNNGVCNPATENCACNDCKSTMACGGGGGSGAGPSSSGGGDGGSGGSPAGNGGAGGSPAGNGGSGGSPAGNGGSGGNGGA